MQERRPKDNISRAVGQPRIDRPLGGGSLPGVRAPERQNHTGRNVVLITAAGLTAAGVGYVIMNQGEGTNPQPTKVPGGIIEQSPLPSFEPSVVIPSATPGATLEVTFPPTAEPTRTAEPIKKLETLKEILDTLSKDKVGLDTFAGSAQTVIDETDILSKYSGLQSSLDACKNTKLDLTSRAGACRILIINILIEAQATGNQKEYDTGSEGISYFKVTFPKIYPDLVSSLEQVLK